MKNFFLFIGIAISFVGCSLLGLNIARETPKKPSKLPKFTVEDSLIGYLSPDRDCYKPYYYELSIDFNIPKKSIEGVAKIHLLATKNFKTLMLNLHQNMMVRSIEYNGEEINYRRKYTGLWLDFKSQIDSGKQIILEIKYGGKPIVAKRPPWEGGFVWKKDKKGRPWIGVACEKVGANIWWPLKDHLSAEPDSMQMTFMVPKALTCVSNGKLVKEDSTADKKSFTYKVTYPINTYNATFYIGHFEHFSSGYAKIDNKRLHYYVLDYNLEKAREHFQQTRKIIQVYENTFGEYPFWRDEFKLVESPYEGMEHQTAIAYGNAYKNNAYGIDYIILHESAHEWWGNAISVKDYADIWIHEGMATYSEALFLEESMGHDTYLNYLNFYGMLIKNKQNMQGPKDVNFWNYKDSDPYMKGALMMHSLRTAIHKDLVFFDILKSFYQTYKYQTVCTEDFIQMVNQKTGQDYHWFFKQYLSSRQVPKLVYYLEVKANTRDQVLYFKWENVATDFVMPIYITDVFGNTKMIYPSTTENTLKASGSSMMRIDTKCAYFATELRKRP